MGATLLGLGLRLLAAQGDLGLDEIWSLRLAAGLHAPGDVFFALPHDNNHPLNSLWLYLLGEGRPTWLYRLPAIVLGTATVPAMAQYLGRRSSAAGMIAAVLAAVALPLVDFGSEARGYAGLAFASVLALDAWERAVAARGRDAAPTLWRRPAWQLAAAVAFGTLWHPGMAFTVAVLGLATLIRLGRDTRRIGPTIGGAVRILLPSALLTAPVAAAMVFAAVTHGGFKVGDVDPFSLAKLAEGVGGMLLLMSGLPDAAPGIAGLVLALGFLFVAIRRDLICDRSVPVAVAALLVLPAVVAAARLPNVGYPRYFAICGIVLLALQAEALGTLWNHARAARALAMGLTLALVAGQLVLDAAEIRAGRGGFGATLAIMRSEAQPTYAASRPFMTAMLLDAAAGATAPAIQVADVCATPPDWYIAVGTFDPRADGSVVLDKPACHLVFKVRAPFAASPLSGTQWTLYRRR